MIRECCAGTGSKPDKGVGRTKIGDQIAGQRKNRRTRPDVCLCQEHFQQIRRTVVVDPDVPDRAIVHVVHNLGTHQGVHTPANVDADVIAAAAVDGSVVPGVELNAKAVRYAVITDAASQAADVVRVCLDDEDESIRAKTLAIVCATGVIDSARIIREL